MVKPISDKEFDAKFDAGEDISDYLDLENIRVVDPTKDKSIAQLVRILNEEDGDE